MIIALDYDDCYTRHPIFWDSFIDDAKRHGHTVIGVTMRKPTEKAIMFCDKICYTSRKAKRQYCEENNIIVDVWIDDNPASIYNDMI